MESLEQLRWYFAGTLRGWADRLADRFGYEKKRPRIPGQLTFTSKAGLWRLDGEWDEECPQ